MKRYKCKYCGALIYWEKDKSGTSKACERAIYYVPDIHGPYMVLSPRGEIERGREDKTSTRIGDVLHAPRCAHVPHYITANSRAPKTKTRRGLIRNELLDIVEKPKEIKKEKEEIQQVSLFDLM